MPLSSINSLVVPPHPAGASGSAERLKPTDADASQFAGALARAERPAGPARGHEAALVRATRTRLSTDEAAEALGAAWQRTRGQAPSDKTLSVLVGQWAHETGRGASMLNYNFGGIKGTGPSGMSAVYNTREGWGENEIRIQDRFRAYASAEEGATDYVELLVRRYPDAVSAAERGDTTGFVQALKARGYFTGNENDYIKSVTALANQALGTGFSGGPAASPSPRDVPALAFATSDATAQPTSERAAAPDWIRSSFADEVSRAALLISAMRIGETEPRRG